MKLIIILICRHGLNHPRFSQVILILTTIWARNKRTKLGPKALGASLILLLAVLTSCGSSETAAGSEKPTVVVTTNILGDVVENLVGDDVKVVVIMGVGTDPHDFQASAQQVAQIGEAGALIANGAGFEEGLLDVIESAEADGVPVFEAITAVSTIDGESHDEHDDEHSDEEDEHDDEHSDEDEEHDDEHGDEEHDEHGHDGVDPHFFTDPDRMAGAVEGISDFLAQNVADIDESTLRSNTESYVARLHDLDRDITTQFETLSADQRILVTNHDVFAYFADRYDLDIVGTVIPSGTTVDAASAQTLAELAETIESTGVRAIFADTSSSTDIASTLADEVGGIEVIELFSESLGAPDSDGATYIEMVRSNASRIADALAG